MIMYQDVDTQELISEEDTYDRVATEITWDDYCEYFQYAFTFSDFFERVRKLPGFYEEFEDDFCDAESEYLDQHFKRVEVEEEE